MIEDIKARVFEIITPEAASAEIYFVLDGVAGMRVRRAPMDDALQAVLADKFLGSAFSGICNSHADSLLDVTVADDRINVIYRYDLIDDMPDQFRLMKLALAGVVEDFKSGVDKLEELEGIVAVLGVADNKMAIYQHHYPVSLIKPGKSINIFKPGEGQRFKELTEKVVKINTKFHFALVDDEIYVLDLGVLERFYGFQRAMRNIAEVAIRKIEGSGILESSEFLAGRADEGAFLKKLVQVSKKSPVLNLIPNEGIVEFAKHHPSLSKKLKVSVGGNSFSLKTKTSQDAFLAMLSDNFLRSELTAKYYETKAKDEVVP
jgi:hypothetical protein